ncbi:MAG: SUMF1/EgtB/PvdO family nonheme iron enzyme [Isosphaerales bacterium]
MIAEQLRKIMESEKLTLKCIPLPAGRFLQGSPFYQRRYQDEYPHEVVLTRPFSMPEIPVTQEIFKAVMGKNPAASKGSRLPVERTD